MNLIDDMIPNPLASFLGQNTEPDLSLMAMSACLMYSALFAGLNYWMLVKGHAGKQ